jgi:PAS domain-containing protein
MATNSEFEAAAERHRGGDPFEGEGEMRALCRELDWSETPLGPVDSWSPVLRTIVRAALDSPFPINLWCDPGLVLIYNDAYRHVLGSKHPRALGSPGRKVWAEIWPSIAPLFEQIRSGGPPVFAADAPFVIRRTEEDAGDNGEPNAWFTFSLSPVRDAEDGDRCGIPQHRGSRRPTARISGGTRPRTPRWPTRSGPKRDSWMCSRRRPHSSPYSAGPQHVFEYVNNAYYQVVGYRGTWSAGRSSRRCPKCGIRVSSSPLDKVLTTGVSRIVGREVLDPALARPGQRARAALPGLRLLPDHRVRRPAAPVSSHTART